PDLALKNRLHVLYRAARSLRLHGEVRVLVANERSSPMLSLRPTFFGFCGLAAFAFACGGIADPTRSPDHVATVTGALTGSGVPGSAPVALVWRKGSGGGYAVGADVPVVDGHFTIGLDVPPDAYFSDINASSGGASSTPPSTGSGSGSGDTGT